MIVSSLIEMLQKYPDNADVVLSLGMEDVELRNIIGVREGRMIDKAQSIQNKRGNVVYYPHPSLDPPVVAVILT